MNTRSNWLKRLALGAAGGFAGTLALQALLAGSKKWLPSAVPPLRQDPGEYMVGRAKEALPETVRRQIPEVVETGAARALAVGYGLTFGALYAALRPEGGNLLRDGLILGLICCAAGYLGWLPAAGLMPPVWRQETPQAVAPAAEHAVYGMATVGVYDWLLERV